MKPTRITLLKKGNAINQSIQDIIDSAKKHNIAVDFITISGRMPNIDEVIASMGEIVIRRSIPDSTREQKIEIIKKIRESGRVVLNGLTSDTINVPNKAYQQKIVREKLNITKIPTFEAADRTTLLQLINDGTLQYPFVAKKKVSGEGRGVHKIDKEDDINNIEDISDSIFQNFIKNTGEYRVYMVGGRAVAFFKKVAGADTFKNNISQGGTSAVIKSRGKRKELARLAEKINNVFDITISGIDFLEAVDGTLYFMEINTVPNWNQQFLFELPSRTVGMHIVELGISLHARVSGPQTVQHAFTCIREYYDANIRYLYNKKFHYLSRMYLWTKEDHYKKGLMKEKERYTHKQIDRNKIPDLSQKTLVTEKQQLRDPHVRKYDILFYNGLLFKHLFSKTIYNVDISDEILSQVPAEEFLDVYHRLIQDTPALIALSTHAINFIYNLQFLLAVKNIELPDFNPQRLVDIASDENNYTSNLATRLNLHMYFLTHMIIGASRFYAEPVQNPFYMRVIMDAEKILQENYAEFTLDHKAEFLVCTKLCNYQSPLAERIFEECVRSVKETANIIVDSKPSTPQCFSNSEHRNVLALMAYIGYTKFPPTV